MKPIPLFIKVMLVLDIVASLLGGITWATHYSDYLARSVNNFFPVLVPLRLTLGAVCIILTIFADILLFSKSKAGFPIAWSGLSLVAAGLVIASIMHFTAGSPVSPANFGELVGILIREIIQIAFNLILLFSLLRLKRQWQST